MKKAVYSAYPLSGLFPRSVSPLAADTAVVLALCWLAYVVLLQYAPFLVLTADSFTVSYLVHLGLVEPFGWFPVKLPGRPFIGLSYWLTDALFSGSELAIKLVALSSHCLAMILIYFLARRLGATRTTSLVAAAFRLAWTFNHQLHMDHSLAMYFIECCMLVAALAFVGLVQPRKRRVPSYQTALSALLGTLALAIPTGTYQTLWPLLATFPLALMFLGLIPRRGGTVLVSTIGWYLVFVTTVLISMWHIQYWAGESYLDHGLVKTTAPEAIVHHLLIGARDTLAVSSWAPIAYLIKNFSMRSALVTTAGLLPLLLAALLARRSKRQFKRTETLPGSVRVSRKDASTPPTGVSRLVRILLVGVIAVVLPLLAPSLVYAPEYGSRFGQFSVYGWTICLLVVWHLLFATKRRAVQAIATGSVLALLFSGIFFRIEKMDRVSQIGAKVNIYRMRMIEQIGHLKEGSVVALLGVSQPPSSTRWTTRRSENETWYARLFSDTKESVIIVNPRIRPDTSEPARYVTVTTTTDFENDLNLKRAQQFEWFSRFHWALVRRPRFRRTHEPKDYRVPLERLVVLSWNPMFQRFVEASENVGGSASDYVKKLYPQYKKWSQGPMVNSDLHVVLSSCGSEPDQYHQFRRYPQDCPLVIAAKRHTASADKLNIGAPAVIHVYVPNVAAIDIHFEPDDDYGGRLALLRLPERDVLKSETHPSYTSARLGEGMHSIWIRPRRRDRSSDPITVSVSIHR